MAIAKGKESTDAVEIKRYTGVAPCFVKAVNPTKAELEAIYGNTVEQEPNYVGEVDVNGEKIQNVRITFVTQPDVEGVSPINVTMFVQNRVRYNRDLTKVQVIDKYGRTAWVTIEQAKNKEVPIYSNGQPANIDSDYRPIYVGEEVLTNFIKTYLGIPDVTRYNSNEGKWYKVDNPQDSECRLDAIAECFKGNYKELKEAIALQPTNKLKILFGVRTSSDGKQYQTAFTDLFLRSNANSYDKLDKTLQERKANGAYSTTEFEVTDFKEYEVKSTTFTDNTAASDLPFGPTEDKLPW
jgi:cell division protein ZapA (FtsZ GTPase activity inhibitor)